MIKKQAKNFLKRKIKTAIILVLKPLIVPIIIISIIFLLVCYITDILYLGDKHKDKVDMKEEVKYYYADEEYTEEDSKTFFESVADFLDSIFGVEILGNADFPVVGKGRGDITSYYGYRKAPTSGASTYHSGIDIAAPEGTKLVAILDGKVTRTSWGGAGGYTITIESGEYSFSFIPIISTNTDCTFFSLFLWHLPYNSTTLSSLKSFFPLHRRKHRWGRPI